VQYQGGKALLSKFFAPILREALAQTPGAAYIEPFVGGFNVLPRVDPSRETPVLCSDVHPGLITLYREISRGWEPPDSVSREEYATVKARGDWSDPLTAFVAFGCSFGGKEWGGYARSNQGQDYCGGAKRALAKKRPWIERAHLEHLSYLDLTPPAGSVVYCDPPYEGTTGYRTGTFDQGTFRAWCEGLAGHGCRVFVSEFEGACPATWGVVWRHERLLRLDKVVGEKRATRVEILAEVR